MEFTSNAQFMSIQLNEMLRSFVIGVHTFFAKQELIRR